MYHTEKERIQKCIRLQQRYSNIKRLISKSDFKCKEAISESDLNFKGSFSENKSYKLDISEGSPGQLKDGVIKVHKKILELGQI